MQVFLIHCERWHDIHLSLPPAVMNSLSPAKNRLPRLQKLRIEGFFEETIDLFKCAPQLRYCHLGTPIVPSILQLPWNQLQSLHTGWHDVDGCLELLRLTPNLEECEMSLPQMIPRNLLPPVQLSRLRSITIYGDPSNLIDRLLVPELRRISIRFPGAPWTAISQLASFFSRCSIRIFSFYSSSSGKHPPNDDMIELLQALPELVELDLQGDSSRYMTKSFLTQFAHRQGSEDSSALCLVPMLQTMKVKYPPSAFDILAFADAIQSRMTSDVFKKLEIDFPGGVVAEPFEPATMSRLRQLRDVGLDIRLLRGDKELL
jgi:hypothetical protein